MAALYQHIKTRLNSAGPLDVGYNRGMADPSPRRRFQFRLRTLMIVVTVLAAVCAYVTREAKIVSDRKAILDSVRSRGGYTTTNRRASSPPPPTWLRRILGDETVEVLVVPASTDQETFAEIKRSFPDTDVGRDGADYIHFSW